MLRMLIERLAYRRPHGTSTPIAGSKDSLRCIDLKDVPEDLEFEGEFGAEISLFMPFCNWLSTVDALRSRRIITYKGMSCFYEHLNCRGIIEKSDSRNFVAAAERPAYLPRRNDHTFDGLGRTHMHVYTDMRSLFAPNGDIFDGEFIERPLLIIHNKYCSEWEGDPINFIDLPTLDLLFRHFKKIFSVVYVRHGMQSADEDYAHDHNTNRPFDERPLLARHPEVRCFDDMLAEHRRSGGQLSLNAFKGALYSRCHRFVSAQGGGAAQMAFFSGALLVILHRRGSEERWDYQPGYYSFASQIPPVLAICRSATALVEASSLFDDSVVVDQRIFVDPRRADLLERLSPKRLRETVTAADLMA